MHVMRQRIDSNRGRPDGRTVRRRDVLGGALVAVTGVGVGAFTAPVSAQKGEDRKRSNEIVLLSLNNPVRYRIKVSGSIEFGEEAGENDEIRGDTVVGKIDGPNAPDNYHFSGVITEFELIEGKADIFVNGEKVDDPVGLPKRAEKRAKKRPKQIVLKALSDRVEYRITGDDSIEAGKEAGENDKIEDAAVAGLIDGKGGVDNYSFAGSTLSVEVSKGKVAFAVSDGGDKSNSDDLPNLITVRGLGSTIRYVITVTGMIEFGSQAEEEETDIPADRSIDDDTIEGFIHAHGDNPGVDDYRYSGALEFTSEAPFGVEIEYGGN